MDTALHSFVGHLLRGPEPHTEQEDKDPKSGSSHGCPSEKFSGSAGLLQFSKPGLLRGRAACTGLILAVWSLLWGQVCPPPSPGESWAELSLTRSRSSLHSQPLPQAHAWAPEERRPKGGLDFRGFWPHWGPPPEHYPLLILKLPFSTLP